MVGYRKGISNSVYAHVHDGANHLVSLFKAIVHKFSDDGSFAHYNEHIVT